MDQNQLRVGLIAVGLSAKDFAHLLQVTPRAVSMWLSGERPIPGPIIAYLDLLVSLPNEQRHPYLKSKLIGELKMRNGMYGVSFQGILGAGEGVLIVQDGLVYGSDTGGGKYDGTCHIDGTSGLAQMRLVCEMPANQPSVLGPARPYQWTVQVVATLNAQADEGPVRVVTDMGQAEAYFRFMRELPIAA